MGDGEEKAGAFFTGKFNVKVTHCLLLFLKFFFYFICSLMSPAQTSRLQGFRGDNAMKTGGNVSNWVSKLKVENTSTIQCHPVI